MCDFSKAIGQPVLGVKEKLLEINSNLFFRRLEVHEKAKFFILQMDDVIRDVYWERLNLPKSVTSVTFDGSSLLGGECFRVAFWRDQSDGSSFESAFFSWLKYSILISANRFDYGIYIYILIYLDLAIHRSQPSSLQFVSL